MKEKIAHELILGYNTVIEYSNYRRLQYPMTVLTRAYVNICGTGIYNILNDLTTLLAVFFDEYFIWLIGPANTCLDKDICRWGPTQQFYFSLIIKQICTFHGKGWCLNHSKDYDVKRWRSLSFALKFIGLTCIREHPLHSTRYIPYAYIRIGVCALYHASGFRWSQMKASQSYRIMAYRCLI